MAEMRKATPYFPFWAKDWLTSEATRLMTPEQKGAFIDLLCHQWQSTSEPCTLPADDDSLARLSGLGKRWKTVGAAVRAQFDTLPSGRLANAELLRVYGDVQERYGRRAGAGSIGGKRKAERAKQTPSIARENGLAMLESPASNATILLDDCSSNALATKAKRKVKEKVPSPSASPGSSNASPESGSEERFPPPVYDWLHREWSARFGVVGVPQFRAGIKALLATGARAGQLARAFQAYREDTEQSKRAAKFAWFVEDAQRYIAEGDACAVELVPDPSVFGLTDEQRTVTVLEHRRQLEVEDAALLDRILGVVAA